MGYSGNILALDIATVTGFAVGRPGDAPKFGSIDCGNDERHHGRMGISFSKSLQELIKTEDPDVIAFEEPIPPQRLGKFTNKHTTAILYGLPFLAETIAERYGVKIYCVLVSSVRAHFVPGMTVPKGLKGEKKKKAISQVVIKKCADLGWITEDGDAADALAVWSFARSCLCPELAIATTPLFNQQVTA